MKSITLCGLASLMLIASPAFAQGHGNAGMGATMGGGIGTMGGMGNNGIGMGNAGSLDTGIQQRDLARSGRDADDRASLTGQSHANDNAGFTASTSNSSHSGLIQRDSARADRHAYEASNTAKAKANANSGLGAYARSDTTHRTHAKRHSYHANAQARLKADNKAGLNE
jgi:hypothetical protein